MAHRYLAAIRTRLPYLRRLYAEIDELRHQLAAAAPVAMASQPIIPQPEPRSLGQEFRALLNLLRPHDVPGTNKRRFGADRDGGYVMLDDLAPARNAISLGIGGNVSWDVDMAALGIKVHQFDDSVPGSPRANKHFEFQRKRIVARAKSPNEITLSQIMAGGALKDDRDVILKMDIEGSEWDVLAHSAPADLQRIRQMAVEFHDLRNFADAKWRARALAALNNLAASHACVHVHGNNSSAFAVVGGIPFPNSFEATFVRRADHALTPSTGSFPTDIDRPNNPNRADLHIGRWDY